MKLTYTLIGWGVKPVKADSKAIATALGVLKPLCDIEGSPCHEVACVTSEYLKTILAFLDECTAKPAGK